MPLGRKLPRTACGEQGPAGSEWTESFLRSFVFSFRLFRPRFTVRHSRVTSQTTGPSTPQIIALAMICSGRDDRVGKI